MVVQVYGTESKLKNFNKEFVSQVTNGVQFISINTEKLKMPISLNRINYSIVLYDKEFLKTDWFYYLIGFSMHPENEVLFCVCGEDKKELLDSPEEWMCEGYDLIDNYKILRIKVLAAYNHWMIKKERLAAKKLLLSEGYLAILPELSLAVEKGHLGVVKKFLDAGFSPSATNSQGVPLVCLAARHGHSAILSFLLDKGADMHSISKDRGSNILIDAVSAGNEKIVELVLKEGIDLDVISKNGQTALILAAGQGNVKISKMLLDAGADCSIKDPMDMSAYKYAELFGSEDLKNYFLQHPNKNCQK